MKTITNTIQQFKKFKIGEIIWKFRKRKRYTLTQALKEEPRWLVLGYEQCTSACAYCSSNRQLLKLIPLQRDEYYSPWPPTDIEPLWFVSYNSRTIDRECPVYVKGKKSYPRYCKVGEVLPWKKWG